MATRSVFYDVVQRNFMNVSDKFITSIFMIEEHAKQEPSRQQVVLLTAFNELADRSGRAV
jgi:hypothetical protein